MSRMTGIFIGVSLLVFSTSPRFADWKGHAKAIDISAGEDHTLVLTQNKWPWACGHNGWYQLGIGNNQGQKTLVRVEDGNMVTVSGYLEDINDVDAGWKHSLALHVNGFVWAWGWNSEGQLGDNQQSSPYYYSATPVQVHGVNDVNFLQNIIAISAGRSGEHSLAVDVNNLVYA